MSRSKNTQINVIKIQPFNQMRGLIERSTVDMQTFQIALGGVGIFEIIITTSGSSPQTPSL